MGNRSKKLHKHTASDILEGQEIQQRKQLGDKIGFDLVRFNFPWILVKLPEEHAAPGEPTSIKCGSNKEYQESNACELTRNECQDWNKKPLGVFRTRKFGLVAIYGWSDDAVINEDGDILKQDQKLAFYHKMRDYKILNATKRFEKARMGRLEVPTDGLSWSFIYCE